MKKLILTADDFGVVPSIDAGVTKGVLAGKINSVAAFANYGEKGQKSVNNVKELIKKSEEHGVNPQIGVHLTITSGNPILGRDAVPSLCKSDKKLEKALKKNPNEANQFKSHSELSRDAINTEELRAELQAQIDVFKNNGIPIAHLTSHHNTLNFFEKFFKVLMDLAADNNIPIRSSKVEPKVKNDMYMKLVMYLKLWDDTNLDEADELVTFTDRIQEIQQNYRSGEVRSPNYLETSHYGPLHFRRLKHGKIDKYLKDKRNAVANIIQRFEEEEGSLMEVVLHVRDGEITKRKDYKKEVQLAKYAGIDPRYFDSRVVELNSVLNTDWDQIFAENDMGWGSW